MSLVTPADWPNVAPQASFTRVAASAQSTPEHLRTITNQGAQAFDLRLPLRCILSSLPSVSQRQIPSLGPMTQRCVRMPPLLPVATSDQIRQRPCPGRAESATSPDSASGPRRVLPGLACTARRQGTGDGHGSVPRSPLCMLASHSGPTFRLVRPGLGLVRAQSASEPLLSQIGPPQPGHAWGDTRSDRCSTLPVAASDQPPGVRIRIRSESACCPAATGSFWDSPVHCPTLSAQSTSEHLPPRSGEGGCERDISLRPSSPPQIFQDSLHRALKSDQLGASPLGQIWTNVHASSPKQRRGRGNCSQHKSHPDSSNCSSFSSSSIARCRKLAQPLSNSGCVTQ